MSTVSVLFVCLGNICRSPTAHGVCAQLVAARELQDVVQIDSAGTGDWHVGKAPDRRATAAARRRGYDLGGLRARTVEVEDFHRFDHILAMDRSNLADLEAMAPPDCHARIGLLLDYGSADETEVPDPYYGGDDGFHRVLDLIEDAVGDWLDRAVVRTGRG